MEALTCLTLFPAVALLAVAHIRLSVVVTCPAIDAWLRRALVEFWRTDINN